MKGYNNAGKGLVMGAGIGLVIGAAMGNAAMGIAFGPAIGLILGAIFSSGENTNDEDIEKDKDVRNDNLPPE